MDELQDSVEQQRKDVEPEEVPAEDPPPDDEDVMVTLGSSGSTVTEFDELVDVVPREPDDPLDR